MNAIRVLKKNTIPTELKEWITTNVGHLGDGWDMVDVGFVQFARFELASHTMMIKLLFNEKWHVEVLDDSDNVMLDSLIAGRNNA